MSCPPTPPSSTSRRFPTAAATRPRPYRFSHPHPFAPFDRGKYRKYLHHRRRSLLDDAARRIRIAADHDDWLQHAQLRAPRCQTAFCYTINVLTPGLARRPRQLADGQICGLAGDLPVCQLIGRARPRDRSHYNFSFGQLRRTKPRNRPD